MDRSGRILVVEDNAANQELLRLQLGQLGYAVDVASSGRKGYELWVANDYDLVLTDCSMPEMDGFELTSNIRRAEADKTRPTPVIAITGYASDVEDPRFAAAGMNGCIYKPIRLADLERALSAWLPGAPRAAASACAEQAGDETSEGAAAKSTGTRIDPFALRTLVGDDPVAVQRIAEKFLESTPECVRAIHDACSDRSAMSIAVCAHKLTASARLVGGNGLADFCKALETAAKTEDWQKILTLNAAIDAAVEEVIEFIKAI